MQSHHLVWKHVFESSFHFLLCTVWCFIVFALFSLPQVTACITDITSRTSLAYRESSPGSSFARQKTKDLPNTDFSVILHRHTAVTQHGMVYSHKRLYAQNTSKDKDICIKLHFFKNGFKCLLQMQTNTSCLFCNVKWFWAYPAISGNKHVWP